jgi:hypothetical protein
MANKKTAPSGAVFSHLEILRQDEAIRLHAFGNLDAIRRLALMSYRQKLKP